MNNKLNSDSVSLFLLNSYHQRLISAIGLVGKDDKIEWVQVPSLALEVLNDGAAIGTAFVFTGQAAENTNGKTEDRETNSKARVIVFKLQIFKISENNKSKIRLLTKPMRQMGQAPTIMMFVEAG